MGLGWPAREGWVSLRLPPAVTVHTDRYDGSRMLEEVDAYDRRRDARFSIPAAGQRMTAEYGVAPFYGWSEDKARQYATPQRKQLARFLADRKSVVEGQSVSVRGAHGGRCIIKKKQHIKKTR